jgi:hypothetical protein
MIPHARGRARFRRHPWRKDQARDALKPNSDDRGQGAAWERLEDQIGWYDDKSAHHERWFKRIKIVQLVAAALIPVVAGRAPAWLTGGLGAVIVVLEGVQQLFQFQQNWIIYRSTCEALKHEKFLYLAEAGPYGTATRPHALLAERVEELVSQEHAKWAAEQDKQREGGEGKGT